MGLRTSRTLENVPSGQAPRGYRDEFDRGNSDSSPLRPRPLREFDRVHSSSCTPRRPRGPYAPRVRPRSFFFLPAPAPRGHSLDKFDRGNSDSSPLCPRPLREFDRVHSSSCTPRRPRGPSAPRVRPRSFFFLRAPAPRGHSFDKFDRGNSDSSPLCPHPLREFDRVHPSSCAHRRPRGRLSSFLLRAPAPRGHSYDKFGRGNSDPSPLCPHPRRELAYFHPSSCAHGCPRGASAPRVRPCSFFLLRAPALAQSH